MLTKFRLKDGREVGLIGDPHLGKDFDKSAPLHRRGHRSVVQMTQFNSELHDGSDIICMVGDLFDSPYVAQSVIVAAARAVLFAAEANEDTIYVMMAGNHDMPRNLSAIGAWTVFTRMVEGRLPNLHVLRRPQVIENIAFFPWEWGRRAVDQLLDLADENAEAAVGHWDLQLWDGSDDHLVPIDELKVMFGPDVGLYSGHFHQAGWYGEVLCTGSMQPITHGEDPDELFYVTRTVEEVLSDPDQYRNKHVRLLVKPGEEVPAIDCFSVTSKRVREDAEPREPISAGSFDWNARLASRIEKLAKPVQDYIIERIPDADPSKQRRSGTGDSATSLSMGDTVSDAVQSGN